MSYWSQVTRYVSKAVRRTGRSARRLEKAFERSCRSASKQAVRRAKRLERDATETAKGLGTGLDRAWEQSTKCTADAVAGLVQDAEHAIRSDSDDVVLDGFARHVQLDGFSCGAQSAFMILRWFRLARSITRTAELLGTDETGTSEGAIKRVMRRRGLSTSTIRDGRVRDVRNAIDEDAPLLVSMDRGGHWAVVYGYGRGKIYLADPSVRRTVRVIIPGAEFRRRWDGWAMKVSAAG